MRRVILVVAALSTLALAVLTGIGVARGGHTGLGVVSLLVIAMFAFGILGALRHPPEE